MSKRDSKPITEKLMAIRRELNLNIKQMAAVMGVSVSTYSYFENGNMRLSFKTLGAMIDKLKELGFDVEDLAIDEFIELKKNLSLDQIDPNQKRLMVLLSRRKLSDELIDRIRVELESVDIYREDILPKKTEHTPRKIDAITKSHRDNLAKIDIEDLTDIDLGGRIRVIRKQLNITQEFLSDFVGISRSTIARLERSSIVPNRKVLNKVIHYFKLRGLDVEDEFNLLYAHKSGIIQTPPNIDPRQFLLLYFMSKIKMRKWEIHDIKDTVET